MSGHGALQRKLDYASEIRLTLAILNSCSVLAHGRKRCFPLALGSPCGDASLVPKDGGKRGILT
jgi:hypothetical protein